MNFLAPWFLLGALAVAGPIVFHLIRRSARERMPFSSLLFLRPTPPVATRRRQLEHILLLLLRCLAVILLAAGFARPFFPKSDASQPPAGAGRKLVLLLDTSASMRRERLWPKARELVAQYLAKAAPADRIALVTFDQQPRTIVSFTDWSSWSPGQRAALAKQRLDALSPGWAATQLGLALTTAAELFSDESANANPAAPRDIALISDLQEGAKLDGLQGHDWPKGVRVILQKVVPKHRGNAGLTIPDATAANNGREARARVTNARDSNQEKFLLGWSDANGGFAGKTVEVYLPPGQTRTFAAPELPRGDISGQLRLTGDDEDFDNTAWFATADLERVSIAYFGSESAEDPQQLRFYLQRAFPATPRRHVEVVSAITNSEILNHADFAVIPATLETSQLTALHDWLTNGKTALLVLTNTQAGPTLAALTGMPDPDLSEAPGDYALFGEVDFTHPLFAPFADPRFSDFSRIHFWKHRRWNAPPSPSVQVLAKFDDGSPALAQFTIGKGTLLALFAGWQPSDSQLALSTKFVPLMQTMLDWSGGAAPGRTQFQIGDALPSPLATGEVLQWHRPDNKLVPLAAGTAFTETDLPGIYSVTVSGETRRFAVNLSLDESRTAPLSPDDFARLGVPLGLTPELHPAKTAEVQRRPPQSELENRQKLWRWLLAGLLGVALVEILLSGWLGRRVRTVEAAP